MTRCGYKKTPDLVAVAARASSGAFVVGRVVADDADTRRSVIDELGLIPDSSAFIGVPSESIGRWSRWNISGRTITRRDLPKVEKMWSTESPNFGDYSRGTHTNVHVRQVWPREQRYGLQLESRVEPAMKNGHPALLCTVQLLFEPYTEDGPNLLYAASLAREWFGGADVIKIGEDGVAMLPSERVPWEILPVGQLEGDAREILQASFRRPPTEHDLDEMVDRYEAVRNLGPTDVVYGESGFQRYFGFRFGPGLVAFENLKFGNALYVMYENWEELSRLTRTQLLSFRRGEYTRILHTRNWQSQLAQEVRSYRNR